MAVSGVKSLRLSPPLVEAGTLRAHALGYDTVNDYYKGLERFDLTSQTEHLKSLEWSKLSSTDQRLLDTLLLALTRRGIGTRGELLKHVLQEEHKGRTILQVLKVMAGDELAPASASPRKAIRLSFDLIDAATLRAERLGYDDVNAYYKGLARYDLLVQGPHTASLEWAQLPLPEQDKFDARLLDLTRQGQGIRGAMLKHLMGQVG